MRLSALGIEWIFGERENEKPNVSDLARFFEE